MFEDAQDASHQINPESINPHSRERPGDKDKGRNKHEEYEDTPEYRKSLNMEASCTCTLSVA